MNKEFKKIEKIMERAKNYIFITDKGMVAKGDVMGIVELIALLVRTTYEGLEDKLDKEMLKHCVDFAFTEEKDLKEKSEEIIKELSKDLLEEINEKLGGKNE